MLCLDKDVSSNGAPSSVQVRKSNSSAPEPQPSVSANSPKPSSSSTPNVPRPAQVSAQDLLNRRREADDALMSADLGQGGGGVGTNLAENGRSTSNLAISGSQPYLAGNKEPTPSIASDISNPYAAQELQLRLQQLHK